MSVQALVRSAAALLAAASFPACVVGDAGFSARDTLVETRSLEPEGRFSLENVNGRVTIDAWAEPRVRIEAERWALTDAALARLRVEIDGEGRRVDVRTRTPAIWFLGGGGGKVDYHVTLPRSARARVETVNGRVAIRGVSGEVRASTVNGRIEIEGAAGAVEASTVNGGIEARYGGVDPDGRHRFATTNGSIDLSLPEGAGGRLEARTVNGRIRNDLRLESSERTSRRRLEGRLGTGRGSFDLSTVNGSIRLRRAGAGVE